MQRLGAPHHGEGGDETNQAKAMVAVQMGDEDVVQPSRLQRHPTEPDLAALAAVDHERLVAELQYLTGRGVLKRRQGASAT